MHHVQCSLHLTPQLKVQSNIVDARSCPSSPVTRTKEHNNVNLGNGLAPADILSKRVVSMIWYVCWLQTWVIIINSFYVQVNNVSCIMCYTDDRLNVYFKRLFNKSCCYIVIVRLNYFLVWSDLKGAVYSLYRMYSLYSLYQYRIYSLYRIDSLYRIYSLWLHRWRMYSKECQAQLRTV